MKSFATTNENFVTFLCFFALGKLIVPDDEWTRENFAKVLCTRYKDPELKSLTYTENAREVHPLIFDIDFLCKKEAPSFFNKTFWEKIAGFVMDVLDEKHKLLDFDICVFSWVCCFRCCVSVGFQCCCRVVFFVVALKTMWLWHRASHMLSFFILSDPSNIS